MKMKITVSSLIFILLFSSAWILQMQQQSGQESKIGSTEPPILEATPINYRNVRFDAQFPNMERNFYEPFKPREYVRVIGS